MTTVLAALVGDVEEFVASYWSQRPLLRRGVPEDVWSDLLSLEDVDRMLASPRSEVHLLGPQTWIDRSRYSHAVEAVPMRPAGVLIEPGRVYAELDDGATAVLLGLHESWPPLARLCNAVAAEVTMPVQANVYVALPNRSGLRHHDLHDVLVLQLHGTKRWTVWAAPLGAETGDGDLQAELSPGDCVYVPRRCAHVVDTTDQLSVHVTFGISGPTWGDAITRALATVLPPALVDAPLPAGFAVDGGRPMRDETAKVLDRLREAVEGLQADDLGQLVADGLWQPPGPTWDGQLSSLAELPELDGDSRLRRRAGPAAQIEDADVGLRLVLADRVLEMPAHVADVLRIATSSAELRVVDLTGELDLHSAIVLALAARARGRAGSRDVTRPEPRVLLVSMPFASVERPSLALGLLAAHLHRRGRRCDTRYLNLAFADVVGPPDYQWISGALPHSAFAGEWVFRHALFGADDDADTAYEQRVLRSHWQLDDDEVARLRRLREAGTAFIAQQLATIVWDRYDVVGFTSMFQQNLASLAMARAVKATHPEITIVFGGANWEEEMGVAQLEQFDFVDLAASGEADASFPALVDAMAAGRPPSGIAGLITRRDDGTVARNGRRARAGRPTSTACRYPTSLRSSRSGRRAAASRLRPSSSSRRLGDAGGARVRTARSVVSTAPR